MLYGTCTHVLTCCGILGKVVLKCGVLYVTCNSVTWGMCLLCRYEECKTKLTPFLKKVGFNPKTGGWPLTLGW